MLILWRNGEGLLRGEGSGVSRVFGVGGGRRVHYVHRSATMNHPKSHPYFNTHTPQLDAVNYQRLWVLFACWMDECLRMTVYVCITPSCPLWLLFLKNEKKCSTLCQACKFNWINDMSLCLYCTWRFLVLFFFFFFVISLQFFSLSSASYCRTGMRNLVFRRPTITLESLTPIPLSRALGFTTTQLGLRVKPFTLCTGLHLRPSKSPPNFHISDTQHWLCYSDSLGLSAALINSFVGIRGICPFIRFS